MNPLNNSNEETLLNSKPVLRKILEKTCAWGNDRQNLIASHPNFFEIEKEKKYFGNFSPYSAKEVKAWYCVPPCKNALEYAVSYYFSILILFDFLYIDFLFRNVSNPPKFGDKRMVNGMPQKSSHGVLETRGRSKSINGVAVNPAGKCF